MSSDPVFPTMLATAVLRAQHQLLDRPLVHDDPVVLDLMTDAHASNLLPQLGARAEKLRAMLAMRLSFAEERLASAVERGARQYVIIGAGFDTFPWRQPAWARDLRIFAVDHPASLAITQNCWREKGFMRPANLSYVPVDLRQHSIAKELLANGFDSGEPAFCSLLGVSQYLDHSSVDDLLRFARALATGSELVFTIVLPDEELDGADLEVALRGAARAASVGEPWTCRLRPHEVIDQLARLGFRDALHITPEMAQARYFGGRTDGLRAPRWEHLLAAIV